MKIRLYQDHFDGTVALTIMERNGEDVAVAKTITMQNQPHNVSMGPCLKVDDKSVFQELFDDLWAMGMRPSARSDEYKAQLSTIRHHLNDMRAIVFENDKRPDLPTND